MASEGLRGKTLLVVEDDTVSREKLAVVLRREGYGVALAQNGQEALDYLRDNPAPDLILLDMFMPVMDGWDLLRRVQEAETTASIPIILNTAGVTARDWAMDHGCTGFVPKPIQIHNLLEEIGRCLPH
jgi:two-component system, chemotaxis family, chemotaxis protein CheY